MSAQARDDAYVEMRLPSPSSRVPQGSQLAKLEKPFLKLAQTQPLVIQAILPLVTTAAAFSSALEAQ